MRRPASIHAAREVHMSDKTGADMISRRRMLGVLGAGVVFGIGTPAAVLTASDAEAQTPGVEPRQGQPQGQTQGQAPGQRQDQRTDGTTQRQDRRTNRVSRRMARRNARRERAMARQEARRNRRLARR